MPNTDIDIVMRFLVDKGSQSAAKAALAELEKAGIKFNQAAGRFTSGGKFVGASAVGDVVRGVNATPERVWETLIASSNRYGTSVETAAQAVVKLGTFGRKTAADLMEMYKAFANIGLTSTQTNQNVAKSTDQVAASVSNAVKSASAMPEGGPFVGWEQAAKDAILVSKDMGISIEQAIAMTAPGLGLTNDKLNQAVTLYELMGSTATKQLGDADQAIIKSGREIRNFFRYSQQGVAGFMAVQVGAELTRMGKALVSPISEYVKYSGLVGEESQEWLDSQRRLEYATVRIGGVMTSQIAPVLELAADVAEKTADIFEKYPGLATAVTGIAGITFILGTALAAVGQIMIGFTALKALLMMAGAGAGAAGAAGAVAGGAGVTVGVGATISSMLPIVLPIVLAAVIAYIASRGLGNIAERSQRGGGWRQGWKGTGTGEGIPGANWAASIINPIAKLLGLGAAIDKLGGSAEEAASKLQLSQAAVDMWVQFQQQNTEAETQLEKDRQDAIKDAGDRRVDIETSAEKDRIDVIKSAGESIVEAERDFGRSRAKLIENLAEGQMADWTDLRRNQTRRLRDFSRDEAKYEKDYYESRLKAAQDAGLQARRAEEDHQLRILQMRREHEGNVEELLDKQDAFGLLAENKRYEEERRREEEKYNLEVSRRNGDLALRIAEMERDFAAERALRQEQLAQQMADEEEDLQIRQAREREQLLENLAEMDLEHGEEMTKLEAQKNERLAKIAANRVEELATLEKDLDAQLAKLDENFNTQKIKRQNAFNDQLRQLDAALLGETSLKSQWYNTQSQLLSTYIANWTNLLGTNLPGYPGGVPGKQTGGPISKEGLYYLHAGEYVVSQRDAAVMRSGGGGVMNGVARSLVLYQNYKFEGSFTEGDKRWFEEIAKDKAYEAFIEVIQ